MSIEGSVYNLLSNENLGSVVIALAISLVLFGVVIIQGYTYYQSFTKDRLLLKVLAAIVLLLELIHSCMITYTIYRYLVILGGSAPHGPNSYPLTASVIPEVLITALTQGFFAFRIFRLSGSPYISIVSWFLSLVRLGRGFALITEAFIDVPRVPNMVVFASTLGWLIALVFIIGAVVDVIIAASLCYYLKRLTPGEQLKSTSELVNRLLLWIIQTGIVTSAASVTIVISFYVKPYAASCLHIYPISIHHGHNRWFLDLVITIYIGTKAAAGGADENQSA